MSSKNLLALPTVHDIGALIQSIFRLFGREVRLPLERETPIEALERAKDDVDGCLVCCDHPPAVLDEITRRSSEAELPMVLFSSRRRADEVRRAARRLNLPWVDLTANPDTIVATVSQAIETPPP